MAIILIPNRSLHRRSQEIRNLLSPLCRHPGGPATKKEVLNMRDVVWGANEALHSGSDYRTWSFGTFVKGLRGNYFEIWKPTPENDYGLHRAYLSIQKVDIETRKPKEIICLHCDPNEPETEQHVKYKKGPHIHFSLAENPLPHAHIALNLCHLDQVLSSFDSLFQAYSTAIEMLVEQVLCLIDKKPRYKL